MTATETTATETRVPTPRDPVRVALRTIPVVLFLGTCLAVVRYVAEPLTNPDTYFHLRFGHEFLTTWSLRAPGSVTPFATRSWLPTQWSSQVLMALTEDRFGVAGVAWLRGAWVLGLTLAVYVAARRQAPSLAAACVTMLALAASVPSLSARPQVLSYVFVVIVTATALESSRDGRVRWWLVPLTWVWATAHGMWPLGPVISLVAALGALLDRDLPVRARLRLLALPVLCAAAAAATPVGPGLYGAVLNVSARAGYFSEWAPPHFTDAIGFVPATMLGLTVLLRLRSGSVPWAELLLIGTAAACLLYSIRTLPVAAAMLAPLLATAIAPHLAPQPAPRSERRVVGLGVALSLVLLALVVPGAAGGGPTQPRWVDERLQEMPAGTVMIGDSAWGGYLMWRYPQIDIVMHGYGDTFTDAELDRNVAIEALEPGWDSLVNEVRADRALVSPDSSLAYGLESQLGWTVVEESKDVMLRQAPDSAG